MPTIDAIRDAFHFLAGLLVWPVLIGLLGLAAVLLVAVGAFAREAWDRLRGRTPRLAAAQRRLDEAAEEANGDALDLRLEEVLQTAERAWRRSVARTRIAVRVGPSLGLMGTLIPMANALQGLATGDLPALASNMVTAFAATVMGLAISVVAYLMAFVREEWVNADVAALAFHAERVSRVSDAPAARRAS